jgi:hypothetical protein
LSLECFTKIPDREIKARISTQLANLEAYTKRSLQRLLTTPGGSKLIGSNITSFINKYAMARSLHFNKRPTTKLHSFGSAIQTPVKLNNSNQVRKKQ